MIINKYREKNDYNDPTFGLVSNKNAFDTKNMCHSNPKFKNNYSSKKIKYSPTSNYIFCTPKKKSINGNMFIIKNNKKIPYQHILYRKMPYNKGSKIYIYKKKYSNANSSTNDSGSRDRSFLKSDISLNQVLNDYNSKIYRNFTRSTGLDNISYSNYSNSKNISKANTKTNKINSTKKVKFSLNNSNKQSTKYDTDTKNFSKKENCSSSTLSSIIKKSKTSNLKNPEPVFTPLPKTTVNLNKEKSQNLHLLQKAIKNVIRIRRLEYNLFLKKKEIAKVVAKKKTIERRKTAKIKEIQEKLNILEKIHNIVNIQKNFRGYKARNICKTADYLRAKACFCEIFCLLIVQIYFYYNKKKFFEIMKKEFHFPFSGIGKELSFNDKMNFNLISCYYNSMHHEGSFDSLNLNKMKHAKTKYHQRSFSA